MSYPKDLDEYTEEQLEAELARRQRLRKKKLCDYCEQDPSKPTCRFPERHVVEVNEPG